MDLHSETPWTRPHHVCLVVSDLARTEALLVALGIGPWRDYPPLTDYVERSVADEAGFLALRYRIADLGPLELQLVEPGEGRSPQRDMLERQGPGVFSLGFEVDGLGPAERSLLEAGLRVLMRGRRDDGSGFTYFDTLDELGVSIIVRKAAGSS